MNEINKKLAFEYIIYKLIEWYEENNFVSHDLALHCFNKLKITKLHFLLCAISSKREGNDLLDIFDNFYCRPYGYVEDDIYNTINNLDYFKIYDHMIRELCYIDYYTFNELDNNIKALIDESIEIVKNKNKNLINLSDFDLVEICQKYYSYNKYKSFSNSEKIDNNLIRIEPKFIN